MLRPLQTYFIIYTSSFIPSYIVQQPMYIVANCMYVRIIRLYTHSTTVLLHKIIQVHIHTHIRMYGQFVTLQLYKCCTCSIHGLDRFATNLDMTTDSYQSSVVANLHSVNFQLLYTLARSQASACSLWYYAHAEHRVSTIS